MNDPGFRGKKTAAAPVADAARSADDEFKALMREAKAKAEDSEKKKKARPDGAAAVSKPLPKIKFGRLFYFYLAAAIVWLLGLLWLSLLLATPSVWHLALTQALVAGIIVAAHWRKKKA
ncbi:MAG: hypothetical protein WD076_10495 [Parvularculaceae bacterium]